MDRPYTLVFIVGCQRSGTTLLGQVFGARPDSFLIDEDDGLYDWFWLHANGPRDRAEEKFAEVVRAASRKYVDVEDRVIRDGGRTKPAPHVRNLVLKAPNLTYSAREIAALAQPTVAIYPRRNPLSVVGSMMRLAHIDFIGNQTRLFRRLGTADMLERHRREIGILEDAGRPEWIRKAMIWSIKSALDEEFRRARVPLATLKYEDLVKNPRAMLEGICAEVGLPFAETMLDHGGIYEGQGPGGTERSRPIDGESAGRWREQLAPDREADVLESVRDRMSELGYAE